ncbi:omptin family outer membrane protease [Oceanispirochaeta sp.]|jgi:outer membrane protease|uniref:omptin family outer membrane protease n=1 Tax=Oceanispirochaeta sp. TaxID=2035350 RepID=UPI002621DC9F|nr:omptin family outer membrane protease [Oceanispirochaeta sp.]MDA3956838.1 omptin family outer membrane protease [Oceanispirochaeta sp.]
MKGFAGVLVFSSPGRYNMCMRLTVLIFLLCTASLPLSALQARSGALLSPGRTAELSLSPFVSYMTGFSDELVYDSSSEPYPYMSRLHWEINPALISGLSGSVNIGNVLFLNAAAGSTINPSTGEMTDHDWLSGYFSQTDTEWTHYSLSDIYLTHSLLVDYNATVRFYRTYNFNLDFLSGFKLIQWGWTDSLKELDYPGSDYETLIGQNGIDYDIEYRIPYIGGGISFREGSFTGGWTFIYSWMVSVDDHDYHKFRGLHFYDTFRKGSYTGLSIYSSWHWTPVFSLALSLDIDSVHEFQGDTAVYNNSGSLRGFYPGSAGVRYDTSSLSLNLEYRY